MKRLSALLILLIAISASAFDYKPKVSGTFRGFFEQSTVSDENRFSVRMARLSAKGEVFPWAGYFVQFDLCDRGKFKVLDLHLNFRPCKGLTIMAGQMRVPFSVSASRAVEQYYFANRAFVGKHFGNLRSVGVKAGYTLPMAPVYFEGGVFNSTDMSDHAKWNNGMTYAVKANYSSPFGLKPELAFMSRIPGGKGAGARINQYNASLSWKCAGWFIEGEYTLRSYTGNSYADAHAWKALVDYGFPVRTKWLNRWSFQGRIEGITDASNGLYNADGVLDTTWPSCRRLTLGTTAACLHSPVSVAFRINYEQYFYDAAGEHPLGDNNKIVAGVMLHF